jgi:dihydroorotate dehydrogenase (NAD+) catalytic subunit
MSSVENFDLAVNIGGLQMPNPVTVGSGTYGMGVEMLRVASVNSLGALVLKSLTVKPRLGNPTPRLAETPAGMLNAIGLENPGIDAFLSGPFSAIRKSISCPIVANIAGYQLEEYVTLTARLQATEGIDAIEMNVSCPNVGAGGLAFGVQADRLKELVSAVRAETSLPLWVKLSPNVTDIVEIAQAALAGGADALTLVNSLLGTDIDLQTRRPVLANVTGGLSGPAIRPVALRMVQQVYAATGATIIGLGGIASVEDAMKFILAGASAVAIGTANFIRPDWAPKLSKELAHMGKEMGASSIAELVGSLITD